MLCSGICETEAPHGNLYKFSGKFKIGQRTYALDFEQMLLKGTFLKNTKWVVGLVVYTGKETRIMMNSRNVRNKLSDIEKIINKFSIFIVTAMLFMSMILAIFGGIWHSNTYAYGAIVESDSSLSQAKAQDLKERCLTFVRYFQLLSLFLPT